MRLDVQQIEGAKFLAARKAALLGDEPGFGKTAQAVHASDIVFARSILVVTTASARANWLAEFDMWSLERRSGFAAYTTTDTIPASAEIVVAAWSNVGAPQILQQLAARDWDVLILDESHYGKNPAAARTKAVFGKLAPCARRTWCLSGSPAPEGPQDLYPMLRALAPDRMPLNHDGFIRRYCVTRPIWRGGRRIDVVEKGSNLDEVMALPRQVWQGGRRIDVVKGGKNLDELAALLRPFMLRRKATGLPPIRYSTYLLRAEGLVAEDVDEQAVLAAAEAGDSTSLDMHLGTLRKHTGLLKARACAALVKEWLESGVDKIVLFHWHKEVGQILRQELAPFGVAAIDGSTPGPLRQGEVERFQKGPARVFVGQILAAGEAITLTAACQCLFVEASFTPKDMIQAVRRIFRRGQTRPCLARIAALEGSVDEALMRIVTRKVETIRKILED